MSDTRTSSSANDPFARTALLVGERGMACLRQARVAVFGVGGVGSFAAEALARAGVGELRLTDFDRVVPSNLNRQIHALRDTLGRPKVEVMAERITGVNETATVLTRFERVAPATVGDFLEDAPDYVVDAIDDTDAKVALLIECVRRGIPAVSSMGAANKLLTGCVRVSDIAESRGCPLARAIRKRLRAKGVGCGVTVVYSEEMPILPSPGARVEGEPERPGERRPQGTISYLPALFGLHCAGVVINHLLRDIPFRRRGETPPGAPRPDEL